MKIKILTYLSVIIFIAAFVHFKVLKPENRAQRSIASHHEVSRCPVISFKDFKSIKATCPIVNEKDVEVLHKNCLDSLDKETRQCSDLNTEINNKIYDIQSKLEAYYDKKENEGSYNEFAFKEDKNLIAYYSRLDNILGELEEIKNKNNCNIASGIYTIMPVVARVRPDIAYGIITSLDIGRRLNNLIKNQNMSYSEKVELCEANEKMREARSKSCKQVRMSNPKVREKISAKVKSYKELIKKGRSTKTHGFLESMRFACQFAKEKESNFEKEAGPVNENGLFGLLKIVKGYMNCNWDKAKEFCNQLGRAIELSKPENIRWDNSKGRENLTKIRKFACRDYNYELQDLGHAQNVHGENLDSGFWEEEFKDVEFKGLNETFREVSLGIESTVEEDSFNSEIIYYNKILSNPMDSIHVVEATNVALQRMPRKIKNNESTENFCRAVSCFWAGMSINKAKAPQSIVNAKNIQESGVSPIEPMNLDSYMKLGKGKSITWETTMSHFRKRLSRIIKKCDNFKNIQCRISCEVPIGVYMHEEKRDAPDDRGSSSGSSTTR